MYLLWPNYCGASSFETITIVMVEFEHSSAVFRSIMEVRNMVISYYFGSTEGVS